LRLGQSTAGRETSVILRFSGYQCSPWTDGLLPPGRGAHAWAAEIGPD
jgi:hypothetical protein